MTPFNCSNCGAPCDCDYLCPGCREPICDRCIHLGHEMEYVLGKYRCAKCAKEGKMAEMPKVIITVEDMTMRKWYKGMALSAKNLKQLCLRGEDAMKQPLPGVYTESGSFAHIAKFCGAIADAMLAEDAEMERKDEHKKSVSRADLHGANWIAEHPEQPRRPMAGKLSDSRDQIEIEEIKNAMAQTYNHKSNAAKILGISRIDLFNKLKKYGLAFPPYKGKPSKK
jgi:hypothetical protein